MESSHPKIFVGNVPFQCSNEEFKECFEDVHGFVDAEIVNRHNSEYSRGFGFVTIDTVENAKLLLKRNDIIFKDRVLRFTEYNFNDKIKTVIDDKNYIFVKNVPKDTKREDLINVFKQFGEVGACFLTTNIKTGEPKGNAVVEMKDKAVYEDLLDKKYVDYNNDTVLGLIKWKQTKIKKEIKRKPDVKEIYRMAFTAGVNVGRLEGIRIAKDK
jgi:RNA recognition motif-containing protein